MLKYLIDAEKLKYLIDAEKNNLCWNDSLKPQKQEVIPETNFEYSKIYVM